MQRRNIQRFLVDTNLFISAIKKWAKSTDLLIYLLTDPEIELIANDVLRAVHAATCLQSDAVLISNDKHFDKIREMKIIEVWKISEAIQKLLKA